MSIDTNDTGGIQVYDVFGDGPKEETFNLTINKEKLQADFPNDFSQLRLVMKCQDLEIINCTDDSLKQKKWTYIENLSSDSLTFNVKGTENPPILFFLITSNLFDFFDPDKNVGLIFLRANVG